MSGRHVGASGQRARLLAVAAILLALLASSPAGLVGRALAEPSWVVLAGGRTDPGDFNLPGGVVVDPQGDVYVADGLNHRIQKLSSTGEPLAQWGTFGSGPGQFQDLENLAVDAMGNLYVTDSRNNRIQKFSSQGLLLVE